MNTVVAIVFLIIEGLIIGLAIETERPGERTTVAVLGAFIFTIAGLVARAIITNA